MQGLWHLYLRVLVRSAAGWPIDMGEDRMTERSETKKRIWARWFLLRLTLVLFDILAVNVAYYLALLIRFYVANAFHSHAAPFLEAFFQFAPCYTVVCLIIFCAFKLYSGLWKYAGLNDMNRIIFSNVLCAAVQIVGSCLFVRRMPITYYAIGAAIQFCMIAASRFSYRVISFEFHKISKAQNNNLFNAMVVGSGETARSFLGQLDRMNIVHPVCLLNYKGNYGRSILDGVPVINGAEHLESAMKKYDIRIVIIVDSVIPENIRNRIKELCKEMNVEVQDFSGYLQSGGSGITVRKLAELSTGEVELVIDESRKTFADGETAWMNTPGNYVVDSISAQDNKLVIHMHTNRVVLNDLNASWVEDQKKITGEDISFF